MTFFIAFLDGYFAAVVIGIIRKFKDEATLRKVAIYILSNIPVRNYQ